MSDGQVGAEKGAIMTDLRHWSDRACEFGNRHRLGHEARKELVKELAKAYEQGQADHEREVMGSRYTPTGESPDLEDLTAQVKQLEDAFLRLQSEYGHHVHVQQSGGRGDGKSTSGPNNPFKLEEEQNDARLKKAIEDSDGDIREWLAELWNKRLEKRAMKREGR